jgi:hypothetical protein
MESSSSVRRTSRLVAIAACALLARPLAAQERLVPVAEAGRTGAALAPGAVLTALTVPALVAVLTEQGVTVEGTAGDTVAIARHGDQRLVFQLMNDGQIVRVAFSARGRQVPATAVNAWNRRTILSRAWVDEAGMATCESELDLEGGVTGARLRDFVRTTLLIAPEFGRRMTAAAKR